MDIIDTVIDTCDS